MFKKLFKRNSIPKTEHETKYAFTCGGIDYYQFADFNNIPALRGLKTTVFYRELAMRCTENFLKLHVDAVDNLLTKNKIDIYAIKKLNDQLKQRLDIAVDTELLYKVGSIVYFDENENILDYDYAYNATKIESWRKYGGQDFFLQQPFQEWLPFLKDMSGSLEMYSRVVEELNKIHLENLLLQLPDKQMQTYKDSSYMSVAMTVQK